MKGITLFIGFLECVICRKQEKCRECVNLFAIACCIKIRKQNYIVRSKNVQQTDVNVGVQTKFCWKGGGGGDCCCCSSVQMGGWCIARRECWALSDSYSRGIDGIDIFLYEFTC